MWSYLFNAFYHVVFYFIYSFAQNNDLVADAHENFAVNFIDNILNFIYDDFDINGCQEIGCFFTDLKKANGVGASLDFIEEFFGFSFNSCYLGNNFLDEFLGFVDDALNTSLCSFDHFILDISNILFERCNAF